MPIEGIEGARDEGPLHVALEKALLVLGEEPVAVERIGQRGEASSGHAGDDVDLVDHATTLSIHYDLGPAQLFEHAVRESRGSRATARKREHEQGIGVVIRSLGYQQMRSVTGIWIDLVYGFVDRPAGAADNPQGNECGNQALDDSHDGFPFLPAALVPAGYD